MNNKTTSKSTSLCLVTFILMSMFCRGTSTFYFPEPDSQYDAFGPGYSPHRCNLGDRVNISTGLCHPPHNMVVQVTLHAFENCNATNPVKTFDDQTFMCEELGDFFFLCDDYILSCDENQKFMLRVGHYEPKSPTSAFEEIHAPASQPTPISAPSLSPASGPSLHFSRKLRWFGN